MDTTAASVIIRIDVNISKIIVEEPPIITAGQVFIREKLPKHYLFSAFYAIVRMVL